MGNLQKVLDENTLLKYPVADTVIYEYTLCDGTWKSHVIVVLSRPGDGLSGVLQKTF